MRGRPQRPPVGAGTLTETGRERIESTWRASIEKQAPMAEGLSHEELIQLRHLCLRIVENMQQKLERGFTR